MQIEILKHGFMPIKQTKGSAGFDIFASEEGQLFPEEGKREKIINTGIVLQLNENKLPLTPFEIYGRSGLAVKFGLNVEGGIYETGELFLKLYLYGTKSYKWEVKERIAQLILLDIN